MDSASQPIAGAPRVGVAALARAAWGRARTAVAAHPVLVWWLVSALTALRMYGYYHADELGQVTGFALAKLGVMPASDLPWEYGARIRPWLQPALDVLVLRPVVARWGFDFLVTERIMLLVQLALLTAALPLYLAAAPELGPEARRSPWWRWGLVATAGLWFLPSMLVRHSSEAFSTVLLGAALGAWAVVDRGRVRRTLPVALGAGALAGLAFCARFQVGLFVAGFWLVRAWTDVRGERRVLGPLVAFAAGVVAAIAVGVAVDGWGYGQPTLAAVRYFAENVVRDRASEWGRQPWYDYVLWGGLFTLNPLVWLWLGRGAYACWRRPFLRALAAGALVFLAAHTAIPHKEARFALPLVAPGLLLVWHLFADLAAGRTRPWRWLGGLGYVRVVAVANLVTLAGFTLFGLVRDRNRIDLSLRELPAGATVLSSINLYGRFDELVDGPAPRVVPFTLPVVQPPNVRMVHVRWERLRAVCRQRPGAYVLVTNREPGAFLVRLAFPDPVSAWPPPGLTIPKPLRATWAHQLVRCPDFVAGVSRPHV